MSNRELFLGMVIFAGGLLIGELGVYLGVRQQRIDDLELVGRCATNGGLAQVKGGRIVCQMTWGHRELKSGECGRWDIIEHGNVLWGPCSATQEKP